MAPFGTAEDVERQSPANNRTSPAGSSNASDNRQASNSPTSNRLTTASSSHATPTLSPPALPPTAAHVAGNHSACTCEGARPVVPDPLTGQPVCACQLESSVTSSNLGLLGLGSRAPGLGPAGTPTPGAPLGLYHPYHHELPPPPPPPFLGADQSPFYAAAAANPGHELKDPLAFNGMAAAAAAAAAASGWPYPSMYYPYDPALAAYPFGGYGMDLNGSRRKNATRETTATLKAWLSEHKKNPYPTKGEKIMLAIITKMTLTQVSTWFANARRRLKKENKMTWEPKNRNDGDDDDDDDCSDPGDKDPNKRLDGAERWPDANHALHRLHHEEGRTGDSEDNIDVMLDSDEEELDLLSSGGDSTCLSPGGGGGGGVATGAGLIGGGATPASAAATSVKSTAAAKPKIWSLADMAGNQSSQQQQQQQHASVQQQQQQQQRELAAAFPAGLPFGAPFGIRAAAPFLQPNNNNNNNNNPNATGGGKMFSSFTPSRLTGTSPYLIDPSPYSRPAVPTSASAAALAAYRYPPTQPPAFGPPRPGGAGAGESVTLAYNQLMSSMAAHIQQQQQQHGKAANAGVLENLEKLAALASGASSSASKIN